VCLGAGNWGIVQASDVQHTWMRTLLTVLLQSCARGCQSMHGLLQLYQRGCKLVQVCLLGKGESYEYRMSNILAGLYEPGCELVQACVGAIVGGVGGVGIYRCWMCSTLENVCCGLRSCNHVCMAASLCTCGGCLPTCSRCWSCCTVAMLAPGCTAALP
jgi:hypothetical protein